MGFLGVDAAKDAFVLMLSESLDQITSPRQLASLTESKGFFISPILNKSVLNFILNLYLLLVFKFFQSQ